MDGPFAGAEWQPLSFVQLVGEYDASEFNAMAKLFTPEGFLPFGAQMSFDYQLYTGHDSDQQYGVLMPQSHYLDITPILFINLL